MRLIVLIAVSYTHLDVYKRQAQEEVVVQKILEKHPQVDLIFGTHNIHPVSYTHLDVYKRQLFVWLPVRKILFWLPVI